MELAAGTENARAASPARWFVRALRVIAVGILLFSFAGPRTDRVPGSPAAPSAARGADPVLHHADPPAFVDADAGTGHDASRSGSWSHNEYDTCNWRGSGGCGWYFGETADVRVLGPVGDPNSRWS